MNSRVILGFILGMVVYMGLKIAAELWIPTDYWFFAGAAAGITISAIWRRDD